MSSEQQATVAFQLSGVELLDGPPLQSVNKVHIFIVKCAPHGYIFMIKGPGATRTPLPVALRDSSAPEEAAYASIINEELQVTFDVPNLHVDVYTARSLKNDFTSPFRLSFADEIDFWRFCGAISDAKVAQMRRAAKLLEMHEEAIDRLLKSLKVAPVTA
ncbi:hypothetical protein LXA43DRAFT_1104605 [Ganoderma leucocontextum]|nr:hypothetical protein LXA43DRAFT_1104605 [Ganoderma leucocontextum]